jgi:hypothetical protein
MNEDQNFELGEDITIDATPEILTNTGVLALELTLNELEALDAIGEKNGLSALEAATEAIRLYVGHPQIIGLPRANTLTSAVRSEYARV